MAYYGLKKYESNLHLNETKTSCKEENALRCKMQFLYAYENTFKIPRGLLVSLGFFL